MWKKLEGILFLQIFININLLIINENKDKIACFHIHHYINYLSFFEEKSDDFWKKMEDFGSFWAQKEKSGTHENQK